MGLPLVNPVGLKETDVGKFNPVQRQLSLRKLLDEQRTTAQEQQINQMKIDEAQRQQAEAATVNRAYNDAAGDPDKFQRLLPAYGVSYDTQQKIQDHFDADKAKKLAMTDLQFKQYGEAKKIKGEALDSIGRLPPEAQAAAWGPAVQQLDQLTPLTPEEKQQFSQYPGPDGVKQLALHFKTQDQLDARTKADREAAAETRLASEFATFGTTTPAAADKEFQTYYDKLVEAGTIKKNADSWLIERKKWDAEQLKQKQSAAETKDDKTMGYALIDGKLTYTNKGKAGENVFEPMTPSNVNQDRSAIGLMGNAQLNSSRYKQALNAIPSPVSAQHAGWMTDILSDPKLDDITILNYVGAGSLGPMARQIGRAREWNMLTEPERNALGQYLRAKAAVLSYQRAITNQGRTNPEALHVEFSTVPEPYVGATAAEPRFRAFQENIDQISERFPSNLPGVEHPQDIRKRIEGAQQHTYKVGDTFTQNGEHYKVTKVDAQGKVLEAE